MKNIIYRPMTQLERACYLKESTTVYANAMVEHGEYDLNTAENLSKNEVYGYFTKDWRTAPNEYILNILFENTEERIGYLWVSLIVPRTKQSGSWAFLQWIEIFTRFQRNGLAKLALLNLESLLKSMPINCSHIDLSVFAKNPARVLYQQLGYSETSAETHGNATEPTRIRMRKSL